MSLVFGFDHVKVLFLNARSPISLDTNIRAPIKSNVCLEKSTHICNEKKKISMPLNYKVEPRKRKRKNQILCC